jgi:hypothetical protein
MQFHILNSVYFNSITTVITAVTWTRAVAQLAQALCYKPKGRGFDSRLYNPSGRHAAVRVDSVCNRNEYQEYFLRGKNGRCVRLTTLPFSCVDCHEIWEPQPPGILRVGIVLQLSHS